MEQQSTVLSPKLIVLKLIEIKNLIVKSWLVILIIGGIGAGIGFYKDSKLKQHTTYLAEIIFSMSAGGGQSDMGGLGNLLGMSQQTDESLFSGDNFLYVVKTRSTIEKALLTKVTLDGRTDYFANIYMDSSFVKEDDWTADYQIEKWHKVHFTQTNRAKMNPTERLVLDHLYGRLKEETDIVKPDIRLVFLKLRAICEFTSISKLWAETLLATIEDLYQANQSKKTNKMIKLMQRRVDSLSQVMNRSEGSIARLQDINREAVVIEGQVQQTRLARNTGLASGLFQESSRSLENLKMSAIKEATLFTIIEPVHEPLDPAYFSREYTKFGLAIGLLLSILFIILRQVYRDALKDVSSTT